MATTPSDKSAAADAKAEAAAQAELAKRAEVVGLTVADGPQKIAEAEKAARVASNFKEYVPEQHMEYARAVLRDAARAADDAGREARDRAGLEATGGEIDHNKALNIAADAQAKAEIEADWEPASREEWDSMSPEDKQAVREQMQKDRESKVHDSVKTDKKTDKK